MGRVGDEIGAQLADLRDTPWPDRERLEAWASGAGDDLEAAWASCPRAEDLLALAMALGRSPEPALRFVATRLRDALGRTKKRDPRIARVAFAAEQGVAKGARLKLLDDARHLLADAEKTNAQVAKAQPNGEALARRAAMEVDRAGAFLALAVVSEDAGRFANLAHALRQLGAVLAALRLAGTDAGEGGVDERRDAFASRSVDAATNGELERLAPELRAALA